MNTRTALAFALVLTLPLLAACKRDAQPARPTNGDYAVQTWALPAEAGSVAPDLVTAPGGRVLLGWINRRQGRRNALQFASYTDETGWQSQPGRKSEGQWPYQAASSCASSSSMTFPRFGPLLRLASTRRTASVSDILLTAAISRAIRSRAASYSWRSE